MKVFFTLLFALIFVSCTKEISQPTEGDWRVVLDLGDGKELPFKMTYKANNSIVFYNAEEEVEITDVAMVNDSISIEHPVFEGVFKGVFTDKLIEGDFIKPSLDRVVPFRMTFGFTSRFENIDASSKDITGNWETVFSPNTEEDRYIAKGIFKQTGNLVTGTFRTTTGDYRYLEGAMDGDSLRLSTFDGAHAFLFEAKVTDSTLQGDFYSGNHWKEPFVAKRNETYELPDANSLTFLKEGYDSFNFSFPDTDGKLVSLSDAQFENKVVVVQIMGTWCPNCLEETQYYTEYLANNPSNELAFVSLAFEYASTKERAIKGINRLKERVGVPYPILLAQYESSDKGKANDKLPMLNHVLSYPTTIFIDKSGEVRKIHTGFNGKATGEKHEEFTSEFESFLATLLNE